MGVVQYILLSGKVPFPGRNELEIISNVVKGEFHFNHEAFKTVSPECKDLICHLLVKDVNKRFSAEEAYNHKWITMNAPDDGAPATASSMQQLPSIVFQEMQDTVQQMRLRKAALTELASRVPERNFQDLKDSLRMSDRDRTGRVPNEQF
jgi:serine/threonine protein kinase